jgi:hypothetical protein
MDGAAVTLLPKTLVRPDASAAKHSEQTRETQWAEARSVFTIYLAIAKQLGSEVPFGADKRILPDEPSAELFEQVRAWLGQMDQQVQVHQLRHLLQMTTLNANEAGLRAMILRHLQKTSKSTTDRDKIDFLLVQYFALCAPAKIYHKQIELSDVAQVLKPVLGAVDSTPLEWCAPLERMIETLQSFRSLREILKTNFIEQGRRVKESAGGMFYDPRALIAFGRFNFLLRRTFIELMHADLIAIRNGIGQLEAANVRTMDCRKLELSASEPLPKVRQIAADWKQPFQKEYTERAVNQAFEKLLALRSEVERSLERVYGKAGESAGTNPHGEGPRVAAPGERPGIAFPAERGDAAPRQSEAADARSSRAAASETLDLETCMEKIWEQLIAAPPSRGRSMTTVTVGKARILMSSWEVAAFVSEDGPSAEDLRRAVVARAMLIAAMESAKETGNATGLERALSVARVEVSRLQERVDIAKQAKDTEAAVNLGISTKRLVSALDETEKI